MLIKAVLFIVLLALVNAAPFKTNSDARGAPVVIFASTSSGLLTQSLPDNVTATVSTSETEGVAYNVNLKKLYYVETRYSNGILQITRSNKNGTDKEVMFQRTDYYYDPIYALAIDQSTNNVYYSFEHEIVMCDSEFVTCKAVVSLIDLVNDCWGLAVNPSEGAIYWTNREPLSNVIKAGIDGSNPRVILSGLDQPGDILVDGDRLLWTHTPNSTIHTSDLDGGNHRVFLDLGDRNYVIGLATDKTTLYFGNWGQGTVQSCNKFDGSDVATLTDKISARYVDVYSPAPAVPIGILASTSNGLLTQTLPDNVTSTVSTAEARGVAYNSNLKKVYYVESRYSNGILQIIRSNVDGSNKEILFERTDYYYYDIYALAIDQSTNNVYYSFEHEIVMCDSEFVSCKALVSSIDLVNDCWGLAVNPSEGAIYWTNRARLSNLIKAGIDGSNPRVIASGLDQPGDVLVDGDRLLWTNTPSSTIYTSDLDGGNNRVFLDLGEGNDVIGLATDEETLYISNWGKGTVQSCSKFDGSDLATLTANISVRYLDVYDPTVVIPAVPIGVIASTSSGLLTQTLPDNVTSTVSTAEARGVAYNSNLKKVYYVESRYSDGILQIIRSNVDGSDKEILFERTEYYYYDIYALAIDQTTNNVYYSFEHEIVMCDSELVTCKAVVSSIDLVNNCWGLAVNPSEGAIYWTNRARLSNLIKAGIDGSNPRVIASGLDQPGDVLVDGDRLLWTNTPSSTIYTSDLDGGNSRVFLDLGDGNDVIGLATDEKTLYISNWGKGTVQSCNKLNGADLATISANISVRYLDVYDPTVVIPAVPIGVIASTSTGLLTQTLPDNVTTTVSTSEARGVAYNSNLKKVYYVESRYSDGILQIIRSNVDGSDKEILFERTEYYYYDIYALAIDQTTNNVYYSFEHEIVMCDSELVTCKAVVSSIDLVNNCWGLAVNPSEGAIYWTNRAPLSNLIKVGMDGSNPLVIASGLDQPGDVLVDGDRLLWTHTLNSTVHTSDLNGGNHRVFLDLGEGNDVIGLATNENTLYIGNWGKGTVQSCKKLDGSDLKTISASISVRYVDVYSP